MVLTLARKGCPKEVPRHRSGTFLTENREKWSLLGLLLVGESSPVPENLILVFPVQPVTVSTQTG